MISASSTAPATELGVDRAAPPVHSWRSKRIALRYSLSYLKLFEVGFRALEDPRPFDPAATARRDVDAPVSTIPSECDVVVCRHQVLQAPIPVIARLPHMVRYAPRQLHHYVTDLTGPPEHAFQGMSSKTRSTVLRKVRNFEKFCSGTITWRTYKTPQEMQDYHRLARQLAGRTYQERLFDSGLPDTTEFVSGMLELAERDAVRGFILFHEGHPIAYLYTPAPDGFLIYDYLGYDPEYAQHSPGTVLQYLALRALHEEGRFPFYYWGFGYSQTKQIFSTGHVLAADVFYFRPTLRNVTAVRLHYAIDRISERAGALLERLQLKQRIKRWLKRT
jgi:hypothetical protein